MQLGQSSDKLHAAAMHLVERSTDIVVRVHPTTSKGITDLLLPQSSLH